MIIRQKYNNLWRFRPWQGEDNYKVHADGTVMPMIIRTANKMNLTFTLPEFEGDRLDLSAFMIGTQLFQETLPRDLLLYGYCYSTDYFEQVPCKFLGIQYD